MATRTAHQFTAGTRPNPAIEGAYIGIILRDGVAIASVASTATAVAAAELAQEAEDRWALNPEISFNGDRFISNYLEGMEERYHERNHP